MELDDYATPDAYAPRPRAAQAVAAQRRQQRHDDAPPAAQPAPTPRQYLPFGIGALVLIVLMIAAATWQLSHGISKPLQLTPVSAFAPPTSPPAPSPQPPAATVDAYAAPDGAILGPIELDRQIVAVAHYGSGWVQATVTGSGLVWLRAADFPALAIIGPDLAPAAQPAPVQAAQEPSAPPPAPVRCAQAGIPGQMAEVCGTDDVSALQAQARAAWLSQYGGNPGALDSPTPQPMDAGSERR